MKLCQKLTFKRPRELTILYIVRLYHLAYMKMANPWTNKCMSTDLRGEPEIHKAQILDIN